jgi:pyridoxamine 5'-phosphate oxidase
MTRTVRPTIPTADPIERFRDLFAQVLESGLEEPTAMALATADEFGRPSVRMVLLKDVDERGFVFFTNLRSRKGRELAENPFASLCFFWQPLHLQVRVDGRVEPVSTADADRYFASRPRGSQIGAWASLQSEPLENRALLDERIMDFEARFAGEPVPRPPFWSGYRVVPDRIEYWYGLPDRLHERESYVRDAGSPSGWRSYALYP